MPVLIVGADTTVGVELVRALAERGGEVRAFASDSSRAEELRGLGAKVAVGDLSDDSHVEGAALGAHTAVLVTAAAHDGRELAFGSAQDAIAGWLSASRNARVSRVIAVGDVVADLEEAASETATVPADGRTAADIASEVAALDDSERL